jgi:peptide/nickel transport system permease protein
MDGSTPASGSAPTEHPQAAPLPTAGTGAAPGPAEPVAPVRRRRLRRVLRTPGGLFAAVLLGTVLAVAVFADVLAPADPFAARFESLAPPSTEHLMGTDQFGRDVLSGVVHGTRRSLFVAGTTGAIVMVLGVTVGLTSGYRGGWIDDALMRLTEVVQTLPILFIAILVIAMFGPGTWQLVGTLSLMMWSWLARVVRSEVLSLREREYVEAAVAAGASHLRICVREILPNALPSAMVMLGLILAQVILLEAFLGFLGLGDPDAMSLGYLAGQAQRFLRLAWWLPFFPGVAILIAALGLNLMSDAINDLLGGRR